MQEVLKKIITSKSKTFLAFCFCFMVGVGVFSWFDWPTHPYPAQAGTSASVFAYYIFIFLFILLFFAIIFWNKIQFRFLILSLVCLLFGMWRFEITIPDCGNSRELCFYNSKKVTVVGWVSEEPDRRVDGARYTVTVEELTGNLSVIPSEARADEESLSQTTNGQRSLTTFEMTSEVIGKVLVKTRLYPEYHYGDTLKITCSLEQPENKEDSTFHYDKYLARYGIHSLCNNPETTLLSVAPGRQTPPNLPSERGGSQPSPLLEGNIVMRQILRFKSAVGGQIERLWTEPEGSFMAGLLYGSKSGLPQELLDNFSKTGVTHIIAVSGFNVTIIATTLMTMLIAAGFWRRQAFWIVIFILLMFVIFTGATASVVRAGIMGTVVLLGQYLGRPGRIGNILVFTAALMVLGNPYILLWDAGFQLSFLATLGLVYVSPVLQSVIPRSEERTTWGSPGRSANLANKINPVSRGIATLVALARNDIIVQPLVSTLSAIIATLPLILYQFGRLSLVAPLVNLLVLWIIPWLMLFGFISLILGFVFYPIGQLVAWVAGFGLRYVIMIVDFFGNKSWSAATLQVPWWAMVAMYLALIIVINKRAHTKI